MKNHEVRSIGKVVHSEKGFVLQIDSEFREALTGLAGYSHIQVYWWADQVDTPEMRAVMISEKPYKKGPDSIGIFATRSPIRPNPLAMTVVPVISLVKEEGLIVIPYIDAQAETPLLDIKPYYGMERVQDYSVPEWCSHWPKWYEEAGRFDWAAEFENAR